MILYRYLTGPDNESFSHRVTLALNKGWTLAGPATLTYDPEKARPFCGQPLLKDVPGVDYAEGVNITDY